MTAHKLLLYPQDPDCAPVDTAALADALQETGFIGAPVALADGVFYPTGDRFLQLLTFLGCSPAIELDPPSDPAALEPALARGTFVHVYLASGPQLQFRADPRTAPPRCPSCRQADTDWQAKVARWRADPAVLAWTCPACGHGGRLTDLRFRRTAAFARSWVEVRGIHPAEAVPTDALQAQLHALSNCRWQYAYLQE